MLVSYTYFIMGVIVDRLSIIDTYVFCMLKQVAGVTQHMDVNRTKTWHIADVCAAANGYDAVAFGGHC